MSSATAARASAHSGWSPKTAASGPQRATCVMAVTIASWRAARDRPGVDDAGHEVAADEVERRPPAADPDRGRPRAAISSQSSSPTGRAVVLVDVGHERDAAGRLERGGDEAVGVDLAVADDARRERRVLARRSAEPEPAAAAHGDAGPPCDGSALEADGELRDRHVRTSGGRRPGGRARGGRAPGGGVAGPVASASRRVSVSVAIGRGRAAVGSSTVAAPKPVRAHPAAGRERGEMAPRAVDHRAILAPAGDRGNGPGVRGSKVPPLPGRARPSGRRGASRGRPAGSRDAAPWSRRRHRHARSPMPAFDPAVLRAEFPALAIEQDGRPVVFLDGPGGHAGPAARHRRRRRLLPRVEREPRRRLRHERPQRRDRRGGARRGGRPPGRRLAGRGQVRPEHDLADVRPLALDRPRPAAGRRGRDHAGSTTRPTAGPGSRPRPTPGRRSARSPSTRRRARSTWPRSTPPSPSGRGSSRSATPRTRSARSTRSPRSSAGLGPWAPGPSSTRSTTRRTGRSTSRPSAPTSSPARPTSSSARTSGSCGAAPSSSAELPAYKVRPADDRWETGTGNFEGLAGTLAAVEYLAGVGDRFGDVAARRRRAASACSPGCGRSRRHERELSRPAPGRPRDDPRPAGPRPRRPRAASPSGRRRSR